MIMGEAWCHRGGIVWGGGGRRMRESRKRMRGRESWAPTRDAPCPQHLGAGPPGQPGPPGTMAADSGPPAPGIAEAAEAPGNLPQPSPQRGQAVDTR